MKTQLLSLLAFVAMTAVHAQVKVGNNPTTIDASAALELESTSKGFLPSRMTTAQRSLLNNPATGLVIYNTTNAQLEVNTGSAASPVWSACIMDTRQKFFYAPTISIPITAVSTGNTLNLYNAYYTQFSAPAVKSTGAAASIPTYSASELSYYITSYDNTVLANISINASGVMTYDVISTNPSFSSFLNVVFTVK